MSHEGAIMSVDSTYPTGSEGLPALERADLPDVIHEQPDPARRRALVAATTAVGGIAVAVATVPFIGSMLPSEKAKAAGAPVEADFTGLAPGALLTVEWRGGFYCACHASKFDLAGRVYKNVPAPTNLVIPQHGYLSDSRLIIGTDGKL